MKLWAVEPEKNWNRLKSKGILRAEKDYYEQSEPPYGNGNYPYEWLKTKMKSEIKPSKKAVWPLWCFYKWEGKPKIDLRAWRWFIPYGEKYVRIEFECQDDQVLLSDYELWFYVLNHWYIPNSISDQKKFHQKYLKAPSGAGNRWKSYEKNQNLEFHKETIKSWDKIFELDWFNDAYDVPMSRRSTIAWVWEIKYEWIKSHKIFVGMEKNT